MRACSGFHNMLDLAGVVCYSEGNKTSVDPCLLTAVWRRPHCYKVAGCILSGFWKSAGMTAWCLICPPGFLLPSMGVKLIQRCSHCWSRVSDLHAYTLTVGMWMCKCRQGDCRHSAPPTQQSAPLCLPC